MKKFYLNKKIFYVNTLGAVLFTFKELRTSLRCLCEVHAKSYDVPATFPRRLN